jgi:hypothetical protein
MKILALVVALAFFAGTCTAQDGATPPKSGTPESKPAVAKERRMGRATPIVMTKDREVYGAEPAMKTDTKLADVLKDPKAHEGRKVRITGEIVQVCQKKGCWIDVKDGDARVQVKFVDYAFFVPLDVAGRSVIIEGVAKETVISEAMRRHYAEDAGKSKEEIAKIKGDEKSVMLMADAVEIRGPAKDAAKPAESRPAAKNGG